MVLPLLIGGGLALLATFAAGRFSKIFADIQYNPFGIIKKFEITMDHIAFNLTKNIDAFTNICLESIKMLSHRIDVSVHLLTNVVMAFFTACSLSLLLYLTDFSPFLRTIVWFLFTSLCYYMVRNYVIHSNLVNSSQQYAPSIHSAINKKETIKGITEVMAAVEPLIKQQLTSKRLLYKPCAVVMGRTGAGKTTLINRICGTKHAAGEGRGSVTRNLFRNDVNCGDNTFSLIDTPGTDTSTETYKHAILLREGLTATKINTIFIVIKYDGRFDKMIENYFEVKQPVYNYTSKIVVMISHWDQSKDPQKSFKEICELFQEECSNVNNLIFCSERSSKIQIANLMYNCISNMKEERLDINDADFFLKFNIHQMKSQMKISFEQYQKKADLLVQDYNELINSAKSASVEDKDEILHMTIVKFKDEMEILLQEFRQQYGSAMQELDYYAFYIKMEKENVRICDEFVEKVVPLMSYNLFDNQDPRNLIKRCPYCHLIWFKTEGCDGITSCGNNSFENPRKITDKAFWKYRLTRIGGKLIWEKNPVNQNNFDGFNEDLEEQAKDLDELAEDLEKPAEDLEKPAEDLEKPAEDLEEPAEDSRHSIFFQYHRRMQILFGVPDLFVRAIAASRQIIEVPTGANRKGVGCGKQFKWSDLPKIEDELILELFKVKTIDQAKQLIQNGSFIEARRNYESNVDLTFFC